MRMIVTSYPEPDLDGTACSFAYAEYLNKTGTEAGYTWYGNPKTEVEIVCNLFGINLDNIEKILPNNEIVITDTNALRMLAPDVIIENVVEIIDHHPMIDGTKIEDFGNRKMQIEEVGAAATLVAERFKENGIMPSRESAILLYYAIVSNTINFKANVTTDRDANISEWLEGLYEEITKEKIKEIFVAKSKLGNRLEDELEATFTVSYKKENWVIGQIEMVDVEKFILENRERLSRALISKKEEFNANYIFLNGMDIFNGNTVMFSIDDETEKELEELLNIKFLNRISKLDYLIMRKEIIRKMMENEKGEKNA